MSQLLCPVLIGRDDEFQLLLDAVDRAAAGRGGAVAITGEAGVGKSRLVLELSRAAGARGLSVLTGRAVAGAAPVALRPLAEAVLGGVRDRGEPDLPDLGAYRPVLGRLVPEWLPSEPATVLESSVVLGEGLLRLLRGLAGARGCVLIIEDLH